MTALGRFGIALGTGVVLMTALGVAVALSYHPVRPRLLCAMPLGTGGQVVYFGYVNETAEPVVEPLGSSNALVPRGQPPTTFAPGSTGSYPAAAFVVNAKPNEEVAWTLGPRTVRLDEDTMRCPIPTPPKPIEDLAYVLPKPEVIEPPPPEPKVEPPKTEPEPIESKPPPELVEPPKVVKQMQKPVADKPIALQLTGLTNLEGGIGVQEGEIDTLGDPSIVGERDNAPPPERVEGQLDGVPGGVETAPAREPKRTAAKVKVRPKGEWPADAPPRAGAVLVRLSLLVGTDGKVKQVKVVRGAGPAFDREAKAIGLKAVFTPATLDDVPVESWVPWDVEFTPDDF